jgi:hypothetical protein
MASFSNSIITVDQFFHRFMEEESPYWKMQNAHRSRELMTKFRPDTSDAVTTGELLDYSWMQFQEYIHQSPGGTGKVVLKKNASDNDTNSPTYYVQWGANAVAGIAGIGNVSMPGSSGVDGQTQMMLSLQREMFEGRIKDMKDIMELTHANNQKEAEIEGLLQPGMQEQLLAGGIELLKGFVNKPSPQLGTMGAAPDYGPGPGPDRAVQPSVAPAAAPPPGSAATARPLDLNQAFTDLSVLAQFVPNIHPNDVLRAVVLFAQKDPSQAETYINMLINQVQ